jgi:hypothetical protein
MIQFPEHLASLHIDHNPHKAYYIPIAEFVTTDEWGKRFVWESEEDKAIAIASDSVWSMQVYPLSPVSFYVIAASTFEKLCAFALEYEKS